MTRARSEVQAPGPAASSGISVAASPIVGDGRDVEHLVTDPHAEP